MKYPRYLPVFGFHPQCESFDSGYSSPSRPGSV